jgi:hypothetical protein
LLNYNILIAETSEEVGRLENCLNAYVSAEEVIWAKMSRERNYICYCDVERHGDEGVVDCLKISQRLPGRNSVKPRVPSAMVPGASAEIPTSSLSSHHKADTLPPDITEVGFASYGHDRYLVQLPQL